MISCVLDLNEGKIIPVRAIPFVTAQKLDPLSVAKLLAHQDRLITCKSFGFDSDKQPHEMKAVEWDYVVASLQFHTRTELSLYEQIKLLPEGTFVNFDEFQSVFQNNFLRRTDSENHVRTGALDLIKRPNITQELIPLVFDKFEFLNCVRQVMIAPVQDESLTDTEQSKQVPPVPSESAHDPLPLNGIAEMFYLEQDKIMNIKKWRNFAKNAKRNGLSTSRKQLGKGKAQSIFDPAEVGEWVVSKGLLARESVNRTLSKNLPSRSRDLKHLFDQ